MKLIKAITFFALSAACSAVSIHDGQAGWAAAFGFLAGAQLIIGIDEWVEQRDEDCDIDDAEEDTHA